VKPKKRVASKPVRPRSAPKPANFVILPDELSPDFPGPILKSVEKGGALSWLRALLAWFAGG